ncbi:MAG: sodium:calcium antiporter [Nanoarchaeota archaeon]|nr:sodium:calcium antiporter [Nanoarchaeota archaeon]
MVLEAFAASYPKLYLFLIVVASIAIMLQSSRMLLQGITGWAKKLGLSDYLVGLFIIAIVASFPELVAGIFGSLEGQPGLVIGTIIGSNIGGLTFVLGIMALVGKKVNIKSKLFNKVKYIVFAFTILPILLLIDGRLGRIDGIILVVAYLVYIIYVWKKEGEAGKIKKDVKIKNIWLHGLIFILALGAMLLAGRWLVFGSVEIAKRLNIPAFIIGTFLLGVVSQLPDLLVIIRSELKGHKDIGMGDLLGSTLTKALLFLGILAIIFPFSLPFSTILVSGIFLALAMGLTLYFMKQGWATWKHGILMIGIYLVFVVIELVRFYV